MQRKKVFISFDYTNDKHYKFLLTALSANSDFDLVFKDFSSNEINSTDISRVKAALTAKINLATHTLIIVGKKVNEIHRDYRQIGFINWINFEAHQSVINGNKIIAVKTDPANRHPEILYELNKKGTKIKGRIINNFKIDEITRALNQL